ncbi:leucyl aminopeptidase [Candidatus Uhrbacteria bacterium]|nr:leucyl aminopeptidase [Candidatus Uhrbacteria bacterium]
MKVKIQQGRIEKFACDLLVVKWVMGQKMDGSTGAVDKALRGLISKAMKEDGRFKGKEGDVLVFPIHDKRIAAKRIMLLGLGEQKNVTVDCVRRSAARIVKEARKCRAKRVATILIGTGTAGIDPFTAAKAMTEGALLGGYVYHKYKSEEAREEAAFPGEFVMMTAGVHEKAVFHNPSAPTPPNLPSGRGGKLGGEALKIREAERGVKEGELYAQATIFARELVNEPASNMVPKTLADTARGLAKGVSGIAVKILNRGQCEKLGMGAYLGVAKGSDHEPYFIHLVYKPSGSNHKSQITNHKLERIAIVGKGITFDSGGLSLKPSQHMETMKLDMAGCAAMLGVFSVIAKLKPNVEVHGISAVCENMPSGRAQKPGDIVRTVSGKTIEVLNTDAEGRLTLADAFGYVNKFVKPDAMVDLATLTGACMVALGEEVAGYMGNDRALLDSVKKAAESAGERAWELPLVEEYKEQTKSHVADFSNITPSRYAGAITAGLFLEHFVDKTPWVHVDIAGPAFAEKEVIPYNPRGATGFGVRMMLELLKQCDFQGKN